MIIRSYLSFLDALEVIVKRLRTDLFVMTLSAVPTPGSSWARTKRPYCGYGGKSAARKPRPIYRASSSSSSLWSPKTSTTAGTNSTPVINCGRPAPCDPPDHPLDGRHVGRAGQGNRRAVFEAKFCCLGHSQRKPRPRSTWPSCSITCWSLGPRSRSYRSSTAAEMG